MSVSALSVSSSTILKIIIVIKQIIIVSKQSYHLVTIKKLQDNAGWILSNSLWVSIDFNVIKDECLVKCGVEVGFNDLCGLADMEKGYVAVGICRKTKCKRPDNFSATATTLLSDEKQEVTFAIHLKVL